MRRAVYLILPLMLSVSLTASQAELIGPSGPSFSKAEQTVISRNTLLRDNVAKSPWLVRRVLDHLKMPSKSLTQRTLIMPSEISHAAVPEERVEQTANPDLTNLDRSSTEAAYDLFQLIKEAGKPVPPASTNAKQ